ncbi:MAG: class I SAM-dependent methyltransferase [Gammaproteobacteria bacterium]
MDRVDELLASYPRVRPPMTEAHRDIYTQEYKLNRTGAGTLQRAVQFLESWMHHKVAASNNTGRILEIGAGSLNHVAYEKNAETYDCVEPFVELFADSSHRQEIRHFYSDIAEIPEDARYQTILSVAVLEHVLDLPEVVARSGLLLAPHGAFRAGIPSEGGLLWGLSWRMSTGIAYRLRTGLDYKSLMRHEHVNTANEIVSVVRHFFGSVSIRRFPLPALHMSVYTFLEANNPKCDRCREFLKSREIYPAYPAP